ncbi:zinc finger protein 177-like isoform X2 [Aricia agestis]|nr:zinc finger protein 177-like isoform X2 [Aricia agestis]
MTSLIILKAMLFSKAVQKRKREERERHSCVEDSAINMCRICCKENGKVAIFNNVQYPNMPEDITQFSGVDVSNNDDYPKHICNTCLKLLKKCIKFRHLCNLSNRRLQELQAECETTEIIDDVSELPNETEESYNVASPTFPGRIEKWMCTTCNKEFQDMYAYNDHLSECVVKLNERKKRNAEMNKKSYLCDICGKTTKSNASLLIHKAIHEQVFPYKCDQCPYKGRTMDLLRIHKRSHLIDKPYKCTQCPKAASTSSNLAKHVLHAHSTTRPHKCTYCDKSFVCKHDMTRHIRDIHLRQGTVECNICYKKFNTK